MVRPLLIHPPISSFQDWILTRLKREKNRTMTTNDENEGIVGIRRKSSGIAALMTLNCNVPNIPIINEPSTAACPTTTADIKKKALRFDTSTLCAEYDLEEVKENKRRITDEIKKIHKWVRKRFLFARGDFECHWKHRWLEVTTGKKVQKRLDVKIDKQIISTISSFNLNCKNQKQFQFFSNGSKWMFKIAQEIQVHFNGLPIFESFHRGTIHTTAKSFLCAFTTERAKSFSPKTKKFFEDWNTKNNRQTVNNIRTVQLTCSKRGGEIQLKGWQTKVHFESFFKLPKMKLSKILKSKSGFWWNF